MPAHTRFGRLAVALLTTLGIGLGSVATAPAASAVTSSISGKITVGAGSPTTICVTASRYDGFDYTDVATACADASGSYSLTGLAAGTYQLQFKDSSHRNSDEFWNDAQFWWEADDILVSSGTSLTGRNATLTATGTISGTVTAWTGEPVRPKVDVYRFYDGEWEQEAGVYGQSDGTYVASGVHAATYQVCFQAADRQDLVSGCYTTSPGSGAADVVVAPGASVPNIGAVLGPGGDLSGTVTSETDGHPIQDVNVELMYFDTGEGEWSRYTERTTDAAGHYSIAHIDVGTYRLKFGGSYPGFYTEYWNDVATIETAADIVIEHHSALVLDAALHEKASISGTLTDSLGAPAASVCVTAVYKSGLNWYSGGYSCTNANGEYRIKGVTSRTYRLHFEASNNDFIQEWWQDAVTVDTAADVVVAPDAQVVRDAVLTRTSEIHGHTYKPDGTSQPNVYVYLYRLQAGSWGSVLQGRSNASGDFEIDHVQPGTYKLRFLDTGQFLGEWWDDADDLASATQFVVGGEQVLTGFDATLRPPATLSGTLQPSTGSFFYKPTLTVYRQDSAGSWVVDLTRSIDPDPEDGSWSLTGLQPGRVRLGFSAGGYFSEYYDDVATVDAAADISIGLGATVTGIDATLMSNTIRNVDKPTITGTPMVGATLTATSPGTWNTSGTTYTYQWLVDGSYVSGATGSAYVPTGEDVGKKVTVRVNASKPGWSDGYAFSSPTANVQPTAVVNDTVPTISGTARVGKPLTLSPGTWTPSSGLTYEYQWYRDGNPVSLATGTTYTPNGSEAGSTFTVRVTAYKTGYIATSAASDPTDPIAPLAVANTVKPSISGSGVVGSVLTASPGSWTPGEELTFSYRWKADGVDIFGAAGRTYKVTLAELNKSISVEVTASHPYAAPVYADSTAVRVVLATITVLEKPTLSGKPKSGQKLKLARGTFAPDDAKTTVAWLLDGKRLKVFSRTSITLLPAYVGHTITAKVIVTREGYRNLVLTTKGKKVR